MVNLHAKFEDWKRDLELQMAWLKVVISHSMTISVTFRENMYNFLFIFRSSYGLVLYRFRDMARLLIGNLEKSLITANMQSKTGFPSSHQ